MMEKEDLIKSSKSLINKMLFELDYELEIIQKTNNLIVIQKNDFEKNKIIEEKINEIWKIKHNFIYKKVLDTKNAKYIFKF